MSHDVIEGFAAQAPQPLRADGTPWPHAILMGDTLYVADSASDLVAAALIEGYDEIPAGQDGDREALLERYRVASQLATALQVKIFSEYTETLGEDVSTLTEDVLTAALTPRSQPLQVEGTTWNGPFPLVGIATDYAPFRTTKAPAGDIILLDPYTCSSLLLSISDAGMATYVHHEPEPTEA